LEKGALGERNICKSWGKKKKNKDVQVELSMRSKQKNPFSKKMVTQPGETGALEMNREPRSREKLFPKGLKGNYST